MGALLLLHQAMGQSEDLARSRQIVLISCLVCIVREVHNISAIEDEAQRNDAENAICSWPGEGPPSR